MTLIYVMKRKELMENLLLANLYKRKKKKKKWNVEKKKDQKVMEMARFMLKEKELPNNFFAQSSAYARDFDKFIANQNNQNQTTIEAWWPKAFLRYLKALVVLLCSNPKRKKIQVK